MKKNKVNKVLNYSKGQHFDRSEIEIIDGSVELHTDTGKTLAIFVKGCAPVIPELLFSQLKRHCLSRGGNKADKPGFKENASSYSRSRRTKLIGNYDVSRDHRLVKALGTNRVCVRTEFDKKYKQPQENLLYWEQLSMLYKLYAPGQYRIQESVFPCPGRMGDSIFTTVTANYNWQSGLHVDIGNLPTLTCFVVHGDFEGGELCFPEYKVGFKVKPGDLLLFNGSEMHGNLPILSGERLSLCCYVRKSLKDFKTRKEFNGREYFTKS